VNKRINALLVVGLTISGCSMSKSGTSATTTTVGPKVTTTTSTTAVASLGAPLPQALVGTWKTPIDETTDGPAIQKLAPGFAAFGTWELDLTATTFEMWNPSQFTAGAYSAGVTATDEFSVVDDPGCPLETSSAGGRYHFAVSGDTLTLTSVTVDACPFRQGVLTAHPWQRQQVPKPTQSTVPTTS
jgi:hypothetical protein